ncbi:hypothetical protein LCGC14_1622350, partial [marine sediment metagenome]
ITTFSYLSSWRAITTLIGGVALPIFSKYMKKNKEPETLSQNENMSAQESVAMTWYNIKGHVIMLIDKPDGIGIRDYKTPFKETDTVVYTPLFPEDKVSFIAEAKNCYPVISANGKIFFQKEKNESMPKKESVVMTWYLEGHDIMLVDKPDGVEIRDYIKDHNNKTDPVVYSPPPQEDKADFIARIKDYYPFVLPDGKLAFEEPQKQWTASCEGIEVSFISFSESRKLFWDVSTPLGKYRLNFNNIEASEACIDESAKVINSLKNKQWKSAEEFSKVVLSCNELTLDRIKKDGSARPTQIVLKPAFVAKSQLESSLLISKYKWAAAMILRGASTECGCKEKHAQIIIEGIGDDRQPFVYMAHLTEKNNVKKGYLSRLDYTFRSDIFVASKAVMQKMMIAIGQEEKTKDVAFSLRGIHAFYLFSFSKGHNCTTWVGDKFRKFLGVDLKEYSRSGLILEPLHINIRKIVVFKIKDFAKKYELIMKNLQTF